MTSALRRSLAAMRSATPRAAIAGGMAAVLLVSACTSDSVLAVRPQVDVGTSTAALSLDPVPPAPLPAASMPSEPAMAGSLPPAQPQFVPPEPSLAAESSLPAEPTLAPTPDAEILADSSGVMTAPAEPAPAVMSAPEPGLADSDAGLPEPAPTDLAAAPAPMDTPEEEAPLRPVQTAAVTGRGLQRLVPSDPYMAGYPRFDPPPLDKPKMAMPAEEAECRRQLKRLGVKFRELAPIDDGGACRIDHPISVSGLSGGIRMKPAATLNCQMTLAFARWTKNELAPAARLRYLTGIKTIHQGSSYSCRKIRGSRTASEHSKGNALDVMRIELDNGRDIDVRKPGLFAFRQRGLLNNVRADGCEYFTTVLGPGYNWDHRNHFHFDLMQRRKGRRACH